MDIMIDLETLGKQPDACIVQIGAAAFANGIDVRPPFLRSVKDSYYAKRRDKFSIDAETIEWWENQPKEARDSLKLNQEKKLKTALQDLTKFIRGHGFVFGDAESSVVWTQGIDFDIPKLYHAYKMCGLAVPWAFWQVRDCRTYVSETFRYEKESVRPVPPDGLIPHRADHDCLRQVYMLREAQQFNKNNKNEKSTRVSKESRPSNIPE